MDKREIMVAFNNQYKEFMDDIERLFPDEKEVKQMKQGIEMLKKANPRKLIELWKVFVTDKYQKEIDEGDYNFFTNKDYSTDLDEFAKNNNEVVNSIEKFKSYTKQLDSKNLETAMTYVKNLSTLCILYHST
jgi:soluble cytochrome b562